jgi:sortase A
MGDAAVERAHGRRRARRTVRAASLGLIVAGVLGLAWTVLVWQWQDPFTALYTRWEQHGLAKQYDGLARSWAPPSSARAAAADPRRAIARDAEAYRRETHAGEAIGRIVIGRLGLNMVLVDGTDHDSLTRGPGRDLRTYMPGENRLVYIAGHRTTYLAPFAHIDAIRPGDYITITVPYGTFTYRAFRHEVVPATDLAMLRSPGHELLRLQACHPRFFATHRYIVDARLVAVRPRRGPRYSVGG